MSAQAELVDLNSSEEEPPAAAAATAAQKEALESLIEFGYDAECGRRALAAAVAEDAADDVAELKRPRLAHPAI